MTDTATIPLTRGMFATVDASDFQWLSQWKWYVRSTYGLFYPARKIDGRPVEMHRLILPAKVGLMVDHKNGDGLDNRRANLRYATNSQNQQNRHRLVRNTSGYRGVTWHKQAKRWQAGIALDGRRYYLGLFLSPVDAARAYDAQAREFFGEFARPNFSEAS